MDMTREQWLTARRGGIGGSDAAAIVGLSSFRTPYQVYLEKIGEAPPNGDDSRRKWGRYLEPAIRQAYSDQTGREVFLPKVILCDAKHPYMLGSIDGYTKDKRVFEAKRIGFPSEEWGEHGSDRVPEEYFLQVQHYMSVTGFEVADVAALIGISDFRIFEVAADRQIQRQLIEREAEFWDRVQRRDPPDPTTLEDVNLRWRTSTAATVQASEEVATLVQELANVKARRKDAEAEEQKLQVGVCAAMGECDTLLFGTKVLATWKRCKDGKKLDAERLAREQAALYAKYEIARDGHRTLLLKK